MSMWTAIALISIASIFASIFSDKGKKQNSKAVNAELKVISEKLDSLEKDLRARVETLERIVTSPNEELKRQFERLDKAS